MATDRLLAASYAPWEAHTRESNIAERMVTMSGSAFFKGLSNDELLEIASCARVKSLASNDVLFMQGQPARHLMMLQTGCVKICQLSNDGNEVILWMAGRGDALGVLIGLGMHQTSQHRGEDSADEKKHQSDSLQPAGRTSGTVPRGGDGESCSTSGQGADEAAQTGGKARPGRNRDLTLTRGTCTDDRHYLVQRQPLVIKMGRRRLCLAPQRGRRRPRCRASG